MNIYKYTLNTNYKQTLHLPKGANITGVLSQNDDVVLYAVVDPEQETEERYITTLMTGQRIESLFDVDRFIGTVVVENGIVVHVFEALDNAKRNHNLRTTQNEPRL